MSEAIEAALRELLQASRAICLGRSFNTAAEADAWTRAMIRAREALAARPVPPEEPRFPYQEPDNRGFNVAARPVEPHEFLSPLPWRVKRYEDGKSEIISADGHIVAGVAMGRSWYHPRLDADADTIVAAVNALGVVRPVEHPLWPVQHRDECSWWTTRERCDCTGAVLERPQQTTSAQEALLKAMEIVEAKRQAVLANAADPTWTEHFAEINVQLQALWGGGEAPEEEEKRNG